jgi:hypothetical protein
MDYTCNFVDETANPKAVAILRYTGAQITDPTTSRDTCPGKSCKTVGCVSPFQFVKRTCITLNDLKSTKKSPSMTDKLPSKSAVKFFTSDDTSVPYAPHFGVNLKAFMHSSSLPLYNLNKNREYLASCEKKCLNHDYSQSLCSCYHAVELFAKQKVAYFAFIDLKREDLQFGGRHEHPVSFNPTF